MKFSEKILYHQIHPAKLAADIAGSVISTYLLWKHRFIFAMVGAFAPAIVGSALVVGFADLERLRQSAFGRYVGRFMTRPVEAWRFAGQVIAWAGAWYHQAWLIVAGILVVLAAWLSGRWLTRRPSSNPSESNP